jgi:hypothetical protein
MRVPTNRTGLIDLGEKRFSKLPEEQRRWLTEQLGEKFGIEAFRSLSERSDLTTSQRAIVVGMRQTLSGEMRSLAGRALTKDGAKELPEIQARTLGASRAPTGETELQKKVRADLPVALAGHEDQLDAFIELVRRYESPAWGTSPLMALVGQQGHGKDEALDKYAKAVLGETAQVVYIDLARFSGSGMGASAAAAFGKNGPLSFDQLKKYEPGYQPPAPKDGEQPEEVHPSIVVLRGVKDLRTKNPDAAQQLADILGAKKGTPNHVNIHFVFDFEEPVGTPARKLMIDAMAEIGSRFTCSTAEFKDLSGDTLAGYAEPILLESLKLQNTGNTVLEIDAEADAVLRKALATPYAPLEELESRLYEWLISKFDTQTSVDREVDVLRVSLNPEYANDPTKLDAAINSLHQQYADLRVGADLFVVNIVGKQVDADPTIQIAVDRGFELVRTLQHLPMQLVLAMPPVDDKAMVQISTMLAALRELGDDMHGVMTVAKKQNELQREDVLPSEDAELLYGAIDRAEQALFALDAEVLEAVPADWMVGVKNAAEQWLKAARIVANTLWGAEEEGAQE